MRVIIADTSCLIIYDKIDKLDILRETFKEIIVTKEVAVEFGTLPSWIKEKELSDVQRYTKLTEVLGKGEASSIALALELENSLLIIDEKRAEK